MNSTNKTFLSAQFDAIKGQLGLKKKLKHSHQIHFQPMLVLATSPKQITSSYSSLSNHQNTCTKLINWIFKILIESQQCQHIGLDATMPKKLPLFLWKSSLILPPFYYTYFPIFRHDTTTKKLNTSHTNTYRHSINFPLLEY